MMKCFFFLSLLYPAAAWNPNNYPFIPASTDTTKIREMIIEAQGKDKRILDIGCGLGYSTSSSKGSLGIDTDKQNIKRAKKLFPNKKFKQTFTNYNKYDNKYDVVTCMFYLNKVPQHIRKDIINMAINIAKERVVFVDISPEYKPDNHLLKNSIYIPDYIKNCRSDLSSFHENILVDGLLNIWIYNKKNKSDEYIFEQNILINQPELYNGRNK